VKLLALFAFILLSSASVFSSSAFAVSSVDFNIKGVSGDIEENIDSYLSTIAVPKGNNYSFFESKVRRNIADSIQVFGFYAPEITINLTVDNDDLLVFIELKLGKRVTLANVNIQVNGDAADDPMFLKLLNTKPLISGANLSHQDYDKLKTDITKLAVERGTLMVNGKKVKLESVLKSI